MYLDNLAGFYGLHPVFQGVILGVAFLVIVTLGSSLLKDRNHFAIPILIAGGLNFVVFFVTIPLNAHMVSLTNYLVGALEFYGAFLVTVAPVLLAWQWREYRKDLNAQANTVRNRNMIEERTNLTLEEY